MEAGISGVAAAINCTAEEIKELERLGKSRTDAAYMLAQALGVDSSILR